MAEREVRGLDREASRADALEAPGVDSRGRARFRRAAGALWSMSPFKKKLLSFFLLVAAVGGVMWGAASFDSAAKRAVSPAAAQKRAAADEAAAAVAKGKAPPAADVPGASFADVNSRATPAGRDEARVANQKALDDVEEAADDAETTALPWTGRLGGWLARLGLSFAAGLILGIFFRTFLKTMAAITALVLTALVALSYFQVLNIDFTFMRQNYETFAGWLNSQAWQLKAAVGGVLPSTVATATGFFFGFRRK